MLELKAHERATRAEPRRAGRGLPIGPAYGLALSSGFPLPGMAAGTEDLELPRLSLELSGPTEVRDNFSGPLDNPEWTGRQGDGLLLKMHRGVDGDVLFAYGSRAYFRLDSSRRVLECAERRPGLHWKRVLLGKVIPAISVIGGREALHAACAQGPGGVVAIMGQSGTGKSTLAATLLERGWELFADDQLTLSSDGGKVVAHRGTPHMSLAEPSLVDPDRLGRTLGTIDGERWLAADRFAEPLGRVQALCLLERGPGVRTVATAQPANPLALAPYMLGLDTSEGRQRSRFSLYADLMEGTPLISLGAASHITPHQLADLLEGALARVGGS